MSENPKPADAPVPPPAVPDQSALIAATIEANNRATRADARAAIAIEAARRAEAAAAGANRPRPADPLKRLVTEDLTLSPEQKYGLLGQAIGQRAAEMTERAVAQVREENARERVVSANQSALDAVLAARPDLNDPANGSKFAAAMSKVKFELDANGQNYSASQLTARAVQEYDKMFKGPNTPPPFVEGGNQPNLGGLPQLQQPQDGPNDLEQMYEMKKGSIQPGYNPKDADAINKMNNDYVQSRNAPLFKNGITTNVQAIIRGNSPA